MQTCWKSFYVAAQTIFFHPDCYKSAHQQVFVIVKTCCSVGGRKQSNMRSTRRACLNVLLGKFCTMVLFRHQFFFLPNNKLCIKALRHVALSFSDSLHAEVLRRSDLWSCSHSCSVCLIPLPNNWPGASERSDTHRLDPCSSSTTEEELRSERAAAEVLFKIKLHRHADQGWN